MLYLAPGVCALCALLAALVRVARRLDEEVKLAFRELLQDVSEIVIDCVDCTVHSALLYAIMLALGTAADAALPAAVTVGAVKLFSSDNVHPTNYFHRTRERIVKALGR